MRGRDSGYNGFAARGAVDRAKHKRCPFANKSFGLSGVFPSSSAHLYEDVFWLADGMTVFFQTRGAEISLNTSDSWNPAS